MNALDVFVLLAGLGTIGVIIVAAYDALERWMK